jgi:hypothetical protein
MLYQIPNYTSSGFYSSPGYRTLDKFTWAGSSRINAAIRQNYVAQNQGFQTTISPNETITITWTFEVNNPSTPGNSTTVYASGYYAGRQMFTIWGEKGNGTTDTWDMTWSSYGTYANYTAEEGISYSINNYIPVATLSGSLFP